MKRLADDPQALPALREMITAARTDKPSAPALARVLARLEGPPPNPGPGATRLVLLACGAGIAALVAIAIAVSPAGRPAPAVRVVPAPQAAPAVASVPQPPPPPPPEVAPAAAATMPPAAAAPDHVSPPVHSKPRAQPVPHAAVEPPAVPTEVTLVERARSALVRGDLAEALATADEHAARYPDGVLVEEREAIAIEALAGTDRLEDARARLARFIRRFPDSSYRRHLERLIDP